MKRRIRTKLFATLAAVAVSTIGGASAAHADSGEDEQGDHVLFAQTDDPAGNAIAVFNRADDGTLSPIETVSTGGLGARLGGAVSDPLASQGSLLYDPEHELLFAVNAGSNTVSVFTFRNSHLRLRQVLGSGGEFPVSLAQHANLLYVLNATGDKLIGDALPKCFRANAALTIATGSFESTSSPENVRPSITFCPMTSK